MFVNVVRNYVRVSCKGAVDRAGWTLLFFCFGLARISNVSNALSLRRLCVSHSHPLSSQPSNRVREIVGLMDSSRIS